MALSNEYVGRSLPGLPSTNEIIALCREKGVNCNGFTYPPNRKPIAYIKYGPTVTVGEMRTQRYVYNVFKQMINASESGVKVPEVYRAFACGSWCYMVMEYIDGQTVGALLQSSSAEKKDWIYDQVAKAIRQLLHVPVPSGSRPGPVGGGHIQHYFFRDHVAAWEYNSVGDLQRHINKVYYRLCLFICGLITVLTSFFKQVLRQGRSKDKVDFSGEEMCLCYSDIYMDNFIITKAGQIYVIDFGDVAFLPKSFMSFVLHGGRKPLTAKILHKVPLSKSANHAAMNLVAYFFGIFSERHIGKSASAAVDITGC